MFFLAIQDPEAELREIEMGLIFISLVAILGFIVFRRLGRNRPSLEDELAEIYRAVRIPTTPTKDDVRVTFHTYYGVLVYVVQQRHDLTLPADRAEQLLWRLHVFNLKHGIFAYGGPFVPLLSYFNYRIQVRRLREQQLHHAGTRDDRP